MARSMQDGHCTDCIFKSKSTKLIAMICHDMSIAKGKSLRFEWEKKNRFTMVLPKMFPAFDA